MMLANLKKRMEKEKEEKHLFHKTGYLVESRRKNAAPGTKAEIVNKSIGFWNKRTTPTKKMSLQWTKSYAGLANIESKLINIERENEVTYREKVSKLSQFSSTFYQ